MEPVVRCLFAASKSPRVHSLLIPIRIVFPAEALERAAFNAAYTRMLGLGDQSIDAHNQLITFLHSGIAGGRIPALESPLQLARFPYNLYQSPISNCAADRDRLLIWRPSLQQVLQVSGQPLWIRLQRGRAAAEWFDIDVRRACHRFVYGQEPLVFGGDPVADHYADSPLAHVRAIPDTPSDSPGLTA